MIAAIQFCGRVDIHRDGVGPLKLTLIGRTVERPDETATLSFTCFAPPDLPDVLDDALVEWSSPRGYRISSGPQEWRGEASAMHVHREVAGRFYQAIPGRSVPWTKRLFWRGVLALAASAPGRRVLLALRRR